MAYEPPSLTDLSRSLRSGIRAEIPGTDPFIWPNNLGVSAKVFAAAMRALYLRLAWVHRQARIVTAEGDALDAHGADKGLTRNGATIAGGYVTVSATIGTVIPAGSRLLRSDLAVFQTLVDVTTTIADTAVEVAALEAGKAGNTEEATALSFETPIVGVTAVVAAADGIAGGREVENDASYRSRILEKVRNPPHGGSPAEYIAWCQRLPGVTRVFVRRATPDPGSVTILFMMDDKYADGIPLPVDIANLESQLAAVAPANANIVVKAPLALPVDVTITALTPNTAKVQEAITAELTAMFVRRAEPGVAGASFVFSKSWVSEAIAIATGEERHTISAPASDVTCIETTAGDNEIAVLGTVVFP